MCELTKNHRLVGCDGRNEMPLRLVGRIKRQLRMRKRGDEAGTGPMGGGGGVDGVENGLRRTLGRLWRVGIVVY